MARLADQAPKSEAQTRREPSWAVFRAETRDVRNFVALIGAQVIVATLGLASTRFLTPSDKGLFTAVYLWSLVGQTLVGLSLPNALLYFGAREGVYWPSGRLLLGLIGATLTSGLCIAVFVALHAPGHQTLGAVVVFLPTAMFLFETLSYSVLSRSGPFYAYRLLQAAAFGVVGLPLLLATHSATLLIAALLLSYVVCLLPLAAAFTSTTPSKTDKLSLRKLYRWSLRGHAGLTLSLLATRLDLLFVTLFLTTTTAGLYAAASAVPNLLAFGGTALGLSLARRATMGVAQGATRFVISWAAALFLGNCALALALIAIRTPLMVGMFGTPYAPATSLVIPLTISLPFWSLAAYESQLLSAVGRPIHQTIGQGLAALILASGSAYGVAHQTVEIVAWSNVVAYVASTLWQSVALGSVRRRLA